MQADPVVEDWCCSHQSSTTGYMTVSSYDNVKPLKTDATAIRRWGRAVVGREGVEGRLYNILNKIYT